ncbi:hypothetical protein V866_008399 [Kwoniella sp. B9012]
MYPFGFFPLRPQINLPAWNDESSLGFDLPIWSDMFNSTPFVPFQLTEIPSRDTLDSQVSPFGCFTPEGHRTEWEKSGRNAGTVTGLTSKEKLEKLKAAAMRSREAMKKKREMLRRTDYDGSTEVASKTTNLIISIDTRLENSKSKLFIRDPPPHLLLTHQTILKETLTQISLPSQSPLIFEPSKPKQSSDTNYDTTSHSNLGLLGHSIDLSLQDTEELDFIPFPPSSPGSSPCLPVIVSKSPAACNQVTNTKRLTGLPTM